MLLSVLLLLSRLFFLFFCCCYFASVFSCSLIAPAEEKGELRLRPRMLCAGKVVKYIYGILLIRDRMRVELFFTNLFFLGGGGGGVYEILELDLHPRVLVCWSHAVSFCYHSRGGRENQRISVLILLFLA